MTMKSVTKAILFTWLAMKIYQSKRFIHGLFQTLSSMLPYLFVRFILSTSKQRSQQQIHNISFNSETIQHPNDGEESIVWWSTHPTNSKHLFIVLPGGMTSGDSAYLYEMYKYANLFDSHPSVVFHSPGIINQIRSRSPAALTEIKYLEHFIDVCHERKYTTSLVGFSAGSMLAIKASGLMPKKIEFSIAIHGPDKIRDVMQAHQKSWSRLDIFFSWSLATTMIGSGCPQFLPPGKGGGLHEQWFPWRNGWRWMKSYTENCFQRDWYEMEEELWSCTDVMQTPLQTPVLRVISENDPIVPIATINKKLFSNLDRVIVTKNGGHCSAFRFDDNGANLAKTIKEWYTKIFEGK